MTSRYLDKHNVKNGKTGRFVRKTRNLASRARKLDRHTKSALKKNAYVAAGGATLFLASGGLAAPAAAGIAAGVGAATALGGLLLGNVNVRQHGKAMQGLNAEKAAMTRKFKAMSTADQNAVRKGLRRKRPKGRSSIPK